MATQSSRGLSSNQPAMMTLTARAKTTKRRKAIAPVAVAITALEVRPAKALTAITPIAEAIKLMLHPASIASTALSPPSRRVGTRPRAISAARIPRARSRNLTNGLSLPVDSASRGAIVRLLFAFWRLRKSAQRAADEIVDAADQADGDADEETPRTGFEAPVDPQPEKSEADDRADQFCSETRIAEGRG